MLRIFSVLALSLTLAGSPGAQAGLLGDPLDLTLAAGVSLGPEGPVAVGQNYVADFATSAVVFHPVRGPEAPTDGRLHLRLEAVEREGAALVLQHGVAPGVDGKVVAYERGEGVVERYEARDEGVYQSLVLTSRPAGTGELVCRYAFESELSPSLAGNGVEFTDESGTGVRVGSVVGVDARGRRVPGSIRLVEGGLEYVLPGAFVETAALPLVVDPLLGTIGAVGGLGGHDGPDVAFDFSMGEYLVAWRAIMDPFTSIILARNVVGSSGAAVGPTFVVRSQANWLVGHPSVASVNVGNRFAVVWSERPLFGGVSQIKAAAIDAGSSSVSPAVSVQAGVFNPRPQHSPVVGGRRGVSFGDDDVVVAWDEDGSGIRARSVHIPSSGGPQPTGSTQLLAAESSAGDPSDPAISESEGTGRRYLVSYSSPTQFTNRRIFARVLDTDAIPLDTGAVAVSELSLDARDRSEVDGDGERWNVVFERFTGLFGNPTVGCRNAYWNGSSLVLGSESQLASTNGGGVTPTPQFAYVGSDLGVNVNRFQGSGEVVVQVQEIDAYLGFGCVTQGVPQSPSTTDDVAVASEWSGGVNASSQRVLLAWDRASTVFTGSSILVQRYLTTGPGDNLGGECGPGGRVRATCAYDGAFLRVRLREGTPGSPGLLVWEAGSIAPTSCGPCTFWPTFSALSGIVFPPAVNLDGVSQYTFAVPSNFSSLYQDILFQWISVVPGAGPCPAFSNLAFSNAIRVDVQPFP